MIYVKINTNIKIIHLPDLQPFHYKIHQKIILVFKAYQIPALEVFLGSFQKLMSFFLYFSASVPTNAAFTWVLLFSFSPHLLLEEQSDDSLHSTTHVVGVESIHRAKSLKGKEPCKTGSINYGAGAQQETDWLKLICVMPAWCMTCKTY